MIWRPGILPAGQNVFSNAGLYAADRELAWRKPRVKVFVAGGTGAIGLPLVRALASAGHRVTALTRTAAKRDELEALAAAVAIADALDRDSLIAAVQAAQPTHVIHQLTALPKSGPRSATDIEATNRLRIDGTRNLLDAAIKAGARRFLVGSFALLSDRGRPDTGTNDAGVAVRSMESQVLEATRRGAIEGVVLRYGMFYGFEAGSTVSMINMIRKRRFPIVRGDTSQLPLIHVADAVSATVLALDAAPPGSAYDIVDDRAVSAAELVKAIAEYSGSSKPFTIPAWLPKLVAPYAARMLSTRLPLSNAKAKTELGWRPAFPTVRDGLAHMFAESSG
jgi:2-alkyl-3-oxoalkanoate reductase